MTTEIRVLGVDTGGTFTDFVFLDRTGMRVHKVLSTPQAPEQAILQGLADMALDPQDLTVIHGSTVATNAVLEGKGARTIYIANLGLGDVLTIGRQAREALYELQPTPRPAPVPRGLCLETGGRLARDGAVVDDLGPDELRRLKEQIQRLAPEAVAINLLFSYLDERFEAAIEAVVPEGVFVSRSSRVLPEQREYERGVATWLNSYVGPIMASYLDRLKNGLHQARLRVMQSHGGAISAEQAGGHAVQMLLSGPAGGICGARHVAACGGHQRLLSFDMGGTSTDVALIDGEIQLTSEGTIADYPVAVPMVDMHTIGAGGGSIARVDAGGLLHVGPESAGADPGPACYGRGGRSPTVTDANLVLGRLPEAVVLGGSMRLQQETARAAVARLGASLGIDMERTAIGIVRLADEHMAEALRVISVQRGLDPRDYTLVSFGGAGGLHVCSLADILGIHQALVPIHGGVLSALGMLVAAPGRELSRALTRGLEDSDQALVQGELDALADRGMRELEAEGTASVHRRDTLDLRYRGQSYALNVPWAGSLSEAASAYDRLHRERYGHSLDLPVELVNVRVGLKGRVVPPRLPAHHSQTAGGPTARAPVLGISEAVPVYPRDHLAAGTRLAGPAIVIDPGATTWVAAHWSACVDEVGNLILERRA